VPSIRWIYDRWLNLEAADMLLSRPELGSLRGVLGEARGLALTGSPVLGALLDVAADVLWLGKGSCWPWWTWAGGASPPPGSFRRPPAAGAGLELPR
jgi:hypothetical protein